MCAYLFSRFSTPVTLRASEGCSSATSSVAVSAPKSIKSINTCRAQIFRAEKKCSGLAGKFEFITNEVV